MAIAETSANVRTPGWHHSLSFRLFGVTIAVILFVEALIFLPSAASYRASWLEERTQAARIAALSLEAAPSRAVSRDLSSSLLANAGLLAVTEIEDGMRFQILPMLTPVKTPVVRVDLRTNDQIFAIAATLSTMMARDDRMLLIFDTGGKADRTLEVLVPEAPLRSELLAYCGRIISLSLLISLTAGGLIYLLLFLLVVRPIGRVTSSVEQFRQDPGGWTGRLSPTRRRDEIGRVQNAVEQMETAVSESFRQRERLAELGEAVARINHDLRGSLAAAQLVSDGLASVKNERVQRAVPRLERALERATNLATQTLQYGKARAAEPLMQSCRLAERVSEAAEEALVRHPATVFHNLIDPQLNVRADPDHLHRIVANLVRNAAEAIGEGGEIRAFRQGDALLIADNGPGLPEELSQNLFQPFQTARKRNGTGLGLAIARDLARAMQGELSLHETGPDGTVFAVRLHWLDGEGLVAAK